MSILSQSFVSLILSTTLSISSSNAQQLFFMQEPDFNQPPAPEINGNDIPPGMILSSTEKVIDDFYSGGGSIPTDTLIDPDGRVVAYSKRWKQKQIKEQQEEKELLEQLAGKDGKKIVAWRTFLWTMVGCFCIVACGIIPAVILPADSSHFLESDSGRRTLHLLLSFAVGSLTGDVFLHLLPTVWANVEVDKVTTGVWTTAGVLFCFLLEKLCAANEYSQRRVCAFLNLIANFVDNFTHGLAIGGSFLIDSKLGCLTTFSIIIHELPHEISDFAILLRADLSRWSAVRAQLLTAIGGAIGACAALFLHTDCATNGTSQKILSFTAGGFINIALAQILPELMRETDSRQSILQWILLVIGIVLMAVLNQFHID